MAEAVQEPYEIDLTDSKTLLISDFEGTTPTAHFAKFKEYCTGIDNKGNVYPTNRVIFLGDVFDNTAQFGPKCKGEECKDPDDDEGNCVDNSNYVALETIKLLVDNEERCKFVVGNRDINKIKLIPFFSFKNGEKWWTKGNSYEEIVNNLMTKLNDNPWLVQKEQLKYFRPFWSSKPEEYNKGWLVDNEIKFIDIYDRFERIFGKDPAPGTMSALVTLKCIPNELFPDMMNFYGAMLTKAETTDNEEKDKKLHNDWRKRVRAALTITVFMRMLDKELWNENKSKINGEIDKKEFKALDGYLYYYLTKAPAAYYAEYNKNLFLFAHGGITNDFVKGDGKFEIDEKKRRDLKEWITIINERKIEKKGGGVNQKNKIIKSINNYNNEFMGLLNQFFDTKFDDPNGKWILPMLTLLDLSAGAKKNPNQVKEPYGENLDKYKDTYEKIYNVFGHASISTGYTFGKTRNKKGEVIGKDTYFLSTDYSTTLFKNGINCSPEERGENSDYNKNYLLAILDGTSDSSLKLNIIGKLILKNVTEKNTNKKKKNYVFRYGSEKNIADFDELIRQTETETLFLPDTVEKTDKVELNFDTNLLDKIDNIDKVNTSTNCLFNGIATLKEKEYYVYSNIFKDKKPHSIILLPFEGGAQVNPVEANIASVSNATSEKPTTPTSGSATSEASIATPGSATSGSATPGSATSATPGSATSATPASATSATPASATSATPGSATSGSSTPGSATSGSSTPSTPAKKTAAKKPRSGLRDPAQMFDPISLVKNTNTGYYEQEAGKHNLLKKGWTKRALSKKVGPKTTFWKKVGPKTRKLKRRKVGPKTRKLKRRKVRSKKRKTLKKN